MARESDFDPSVPLPPGLEVAAIRRAVEYMEKELAELVAIYFEQANVFSAIVGIFGTRALSSVSNYEKHKHTDTAQQRFPDLCRKGWRSRALFFVPTSSSQSPVPSSLVVALVHQDRSAAEDIAKTYLSIFGPDRFFIELQDHGLPDQKAINPELADMAERLGVATIATNDVHYLDADDVEAHDVRSRPRVYPPRHGGSSTWRAAGCISTGKLLIDTDRIKFETGEFYLEMPEQMTTRPTDQGTTHQ